MGIGVWRQSGDAGRGEVGVRLHGVTEHLLQIEAELGEGWPGPVQALQHDRRPVCGEVEDAFDVGDIGDVGAPDAGPAGVRGRRQLRPVPHQTERRLPAEVDKQSFDGGDVEQIVETLAARANSGRRPQCSSANVAMSPNIWAARLYIAPAGNRVSMSNYSDDDIAREEPTEAGDDKDHGEQLDAAT